MLHCTVYLYMSAGFIACPCTVKVYVPTEVDLCASGLQAVGLSVPVVYRKAFFFHTFWGLSVSGVWHIARKINYVSG